MADMGTGEPEMIDAVVLCAPGPISAPWARVYWSRLLAAGWPAGALLCAAATYLPGTRGWLVTCGVYRARRETHGDAHGVSAMPRQSRAL